MQTKEDIPWHYNADGKGNTERKESYILVSKVLKIQKEMNVRAGCIL